VLPSKDSVTADTLLGGTLPPKIKAAVDIPAPPD
jgi:hypothetical protein